MADHLGSTTVSYRARDGQVNRQWYKPWGEIRQVTGEMPTDYQYTGQRNPGWGLYYFKARWFDSQLGRFSQSDSIISRAGLSIAWDRYAYVNNSPSRYTDPTGHMRTESEAYHKPDVINHEPQNPWDSSSWDLNGDGEVNSNREQNVLRSLQRKAEKIFIESINSPLNNQHKYGGYLDSCTTKVCSGNHPGLDSKNIWNFPPASSVLVNIEGRPVYSTTYGTVASVGSSQWGNYVMVEHDVYGVKFYSIYAHLDTQSVSVGQIVDTYTVLGGMGKSGTGEVHLHFEIRKETNVNLSQTDPFESQTWWSHNEAEFHRKWVDLSSIK